ncbi:MAG TPA: M48 family metallopeptidase [Cyclobacteriaceae bacterium]|jgi:predicted Zn-dependent protease
MISRLFSGALIILGVFSCAKVPVTGRSQLSLISSQELMIMSFESYKEVIAESKLSQNQQQVDMIKRVGTRIKDAVEVYLTEQGSANQLQGFLWEFNLIEDDTTINAWAMPGGKVAFYTGILPVCQDELGVAVVMGHEVAHAIANHGRERMSQGLLANLGLSTLSMAMGQNPSLTNDIFLQSIGIGTQMGMLKFSRNHESEADHIGLIFMAIAGYDPQAAPAFWQRMTSGTGGQPPEFLSTHPSHERRISDLNAWMPEAMGYYKKN